MYEHRGGPIQTCKCDIAARRAANEGRIVLDSDLEDGHVAQWGRSTSPRPWGRRVGVHVHMRSQSMIERFTLQCDRCRQWWQLKTDLIGWWCPVVAVAWSLDAAT